MDRRKINTALQSKFKELDRAYLNKLGSTDLKLIASYKTALSDIKKQISKVYEQFGNTPTITQVRKYNRLTTIERQMSERFIELEKEVRNIIQPQIKRQLYESYDSTVKTINKATTVDFASAKIDEQQTGLFLEDKLWYDVMKVDTANLWTSVKRDFETALRLNAREEIVSGVLQGKSYASITKSITERFGVGLARAKTIARTETHKAHSMGRNIGVNDSMESAKKLGIPANKIWQHNNAGKKPRQVHIDANGQKADKSGMFNVGGEKLEAPGLGQLPENNINCHCSVIFAIDPDYWDKL